MSVDERFTVRSLWTLGLCATPLAAAGAALMPQLGASPAWGAALGCAAGALLGGVVATWLAEDRAASDPPAPAPTVPDAPSAETDGDGASAFVRAALEAAPAPAMILDGAGRLIAANRAARERFAFDLVHVTQRARFATLVRRPELIEALGGVMADDKARSFAFDTRVPVERFERATFAPFEADGQRHILITVTDETDAKMSERMRADFLANASHELRTPLTGIAGFIETLRGPAKDDAAAREKFLEIMHVQAERMARLISDLLSLSRIELNEHVAPTGRADLVAAVQEVLEGIAMTAPAREARISLEGDPGPVWVVADWDEVQQVVSNLVDNALKYGRPGGPVRIIVEGGQPREAAMRTAGRRWTEASRLPLTSPGQERDRLYAVLRVEDEGPGIERQHLPRLSERFYRIDATMAGKSGTGLGLAIVKHIVNRHRGGMIVESVHGKGAAFGIYLRQPDDTDLAKADAVAEAVGG
jgi:two-component system phosphate regulon sensor histidine kinase PhoR